MGLRDFLIKLFENLKNNISNNKKRYITNYLFITFYFLVFLYFLYQGGYEYRFLWIFLFPPVSIYFIGVISGSFYSALLAMFSSVYFITPERMHDTYTIGLKITLLTIYGIIFFISILHERLRSSFQKELVNAKKEINQLDINLLDEKNYTDTLLDNLNEGIFILNKDLQICGRYSKLIDKIFDSRQLEGKCFIKLLGYILPKDVCEAVSDYLRMFFLSNANLEILSNINPLNNIKVRNIYGDANPYNYISFNFSKIEKSDGSVSILCIIKNISQSVFLDKELKEEQLKNENQFKILSQIVHVDPDVLNDFVIDVEDNILEIFNIIKAEKNDFDSVINEIYGIVHFLKGNAYCSGITIIGNKFHKIENDLNLYQDTRVGADWAKLVELKTLFHSVLADINFIKYFVDKISEKHKENNKNSINENIIKAVKNAIEQTSREEGKDINVVFENFNGSFISEDKRKVLRDVFVQLTKNAIAHGIEKPEERIKKHKNKTGKIYISLKKEDNKLIVFFKDDGRGIDHSILKKKLSSFADSKLIESLSEKELVDFIFKPRVTTKEKVTELSGRGAGMFAVKNAIERFGGNIKVNSVKDKSCEFIISLPLKYLEEEK